MVFSLRVLSSPLSSDSDTTDTIAPIIKPICDKQYHEQQKELDFFLDEIMRALDIEIPDSLNQSH